MTKDWDKVFITKGTKFCLLDDVGDIRAVSYNIDGIILAKINYGWGTIHKIKFDGKILELIEEIK